MSDLLEERTGVAIDASGIKRIESGDREPRLSEAIAIAEALGVSVEDMALGERFRMQSAAFQIVQASEAYGQVVEQFTRARDDVRELLADTPEEDLRHVKGLLLAEDLERAVDALGRLSQGDSDPRLFASRIRHPSRSQALFQ